MAQRNYPSNGGPFFGDLGIPIGSSGEEPNLTHFWRENRRDFASAVCAAHAKFVAVLVGHPPQPIPLDADAIDLEDRAAHLSKVFGALSVYLAVILDDTAQNVPGRLDLPDVEAHLTDLAADVAGLIERAAEDMREWIA